MLLPRVIELVLGVVAIFQTILVTEFDAEFDKHNMDHYRMVKDWAFHRAGPF